MEHRWQNDLLEEIKGAPSGKVIWLFDSLGATGKTDFAKYALQHNLAHVFSTTYDGFDLESELKLTALRDGILSCVILDVYRSFSGKEFYSTLTHLLDGILWDLRFNRPHVIVMASSEPDYWRLSWHKWDVRELVTTSRWPDQKIVTRKKGIEPHSSHR